MHPSHVVDDPLLAEIRRMMAILDVDSVLLFFKDAEGVYREVNQAYCRHTGRPYEEIIGKNDFELFTRDEATRYRAVDLEVLETGRAYNCDIMSDSRGAGHWFHVIKTRVSTPDGKPAGVFFQAVDVTTSKQAEVERQNHNRVIQTIFDTTPDYLMIKDNNLVYREANRAYCEFFGKNRDEVVGKTDIDLFGDDIGQYFQATDREVLATGKIFVVEQQAVTPAVTRWNQVIKSPVIGPDGEVQGIFCSIQDITPRRKLEDALIETSEMYRASFEDSQAVKLLINPVDGCIVQANLAASRFYGYQQDELRGMSIKNINISPQESLVLRIDEAAGGKQEFFNFTHRLASGELRDVEVYTGPMRVGGRTLLHSIIHDVTERKLAGDVMQASLRLHETPANAGLDQLLESCLEIAEEMTGSRISFFHFLEDDQVTLTLQNWSPRTRSEFCQAEGKGVHYDLDKAGVWANCIRERRTVIHNDYASLSERKELPDGHATIHREMVTPVISGEKVAAIIGVGNKDGDYTQRDRLFLERFALAAWDLAMIRRKDLEIRRSEEQLRSVLAAAPDLVYSVDRELRLQFINKPPQHLRTEDMIGLSCLEFIDPPYHALVRQKVEALYVTGKPDRCTVQALNGLGEMRWFENHLAPVYVDGEVKAVLVTSLDIHDRIQIEDDLRKTSGELARAYEATLQGWSKALELRERETAGHSQRVVAMTLELARVMDVPVEAMIHIQRGALLHDVGKLGIPDSILLKPGPLSADEWVIMRQHPVYAYRLLSPIVFLGPAMDIPYGHHERWDGSGYPRGQKGEEIPLAARIFAVVDVWDALLSDRPYRPAWDEATALDYLQEQAGRQFDPAVVVAFMEMINEGAMCGPDQASLKGRLAPQ